MSLIKLSHISFIVPQGRSQIGFFLSEDSWAVKWRKMLASEATCSFLKRSRIAIRGCVRQSVRPSVCLQLFSNAEYGEYRVTMKYLHLMYPHSTCKTRFRISTRGCVRPSVPPSILPSVCPSVRHRRVKFRRKGQNLNKIPSRADRQNASDVWTLSHLILWNPQLPTKPASAKTIPPPLFSQHTSISDQWRTQKVPFCHSSIPSSFHGWVVYLFVSFIFFREKMICGTRHS